jgi:adenylate cyclase
VDVVNCAVEVQNGMVERNAGLPDDRRILFRVDIHVGDGVNIAARLEGIAKPRAICLSEDAYRQAIEWSGRNDRLLGPPSLS